MNFKEWLLESVWYHGTQAGDEIRKTGRFTVSTSGGGQRGLMGVWLTQDKAYAQLYADALRERKTKAEILAVEIPDLLKIADLTGIEASGGNDATRARWQFLGYDVDNHDAMQPVRDMQPFATTKLLKQQGYDGAMIPNTVRTGGKPELVIFDPAHIKLLHNNQ